MTDTQMGHVHLIGIGGSGLSAIAKVLLERGVTVSGSDRQASPPALSLAAAGAKVFAGHRPEQVQGADLVVRSSAVTDENVEVQAALAAGIPVVKRADFLGRLLAGQQTIAVAGSHGKTTTTSMVAWMLVALGQNPSYIIGGVSTNLGSNAHAGQGAHFVIEADEYDRMFLGLSPHIAVVTNVEHDHPDCFPTPQEFHQAFEDFVGRLQPGGALLACVDDPGSARLLDIVRSHGSGRRAIPYGLSEAQDTGQPGYWAQNLSVNPHGGFRFDASCRPYGPGKAASSVEVTLQVPGEHNARNALAALGVAGLLGLPLDAAAKALGEFRGSGRRFELRGEAGGVTVIDDYAHHPTEIRATLAAARLRFPERKLWVVWQPHTYSRTRTLLADFLASFQDADHLLVTEVYAAREAVPGDGFSARQIVQALAHPDAHFTPGLPDAAQLLLARLRPGDVLLVLSAGDADQLSDRVLQGLAGEIQTPARHP